MAEGAPPGFLAFEDMVTRALQRRYRATRLQARLLASRAARSETVSVYTWNSQRGALVEIPFARRSAAEINAADGTMIFPDSPVRLNIDIGPLDYTACAARATTPAPRAKGSAPPPVITAEIDLDAARARMEDYAASWWPAAPFEAPPRLGTRFFVEADDFDRFAAATQTQSTRPAVTPPAVERPSAQPATANRGGRPAKHDWTAARAQYMARRNGRAAARGFVGGLYADGR